MANGARTLARVSVGTSGWSYPSWRPGFYPAGLDPAQFLRFYAERFRTVELNTTGYRIPGVEQFRRWAEQAPDGFEFAPKLSGDRKRGLDTFVDGVRGLGDRLGPVRVSLKSARDDGAIELILGSLDPGLRVAFDLEHPSWDGIEERLAEHGAVRVNDLDHPAPFRFLRRREAPDEEFAARIRAAAEPVYVYFRHDDEPDAPAHAQRLIEMLAV
ncbi:MAG: DUF72 domain-containing protein [Actinobacteria bacterium]|nr:DUF72 domain-containing protein [Actinomycetota bacterium]MBV8480553.1 DUF72 domain-containing protein [Actinomycetota bacterium]